MLRSRLKSFVYAFRGLKVFWSEEIHAKIHVICAILVILAGWLFKINSIEWLFLILCIGAVIAAELFNTAIERLCDKVESQYDDLIKKSKDVASAAVLILCIMSVIIALIIFIPKIFIAL